MWNNPHIKKIYPKNLLNGILSEAFLRPLLVGVQLRYTPICNSDNDFRTVSFFIEALDEDADS